MGKIERSKSGGSGTVDLFCTLAGCVCAGFTPVVARPYSGTVSQAIGVSSRSKIQQLLHELRDRSIELLKRSKSTSTRGHLSDTNASVKKGDRVNVKYDTWYEGTVVAVADDDNGRKSLTHFDADDKKEWVDEEINVWKKIVRTVA